ncbi:MAG: hypothetical protein HYT72_00450 [Candidatus Aenigmarchaeota archaeon]|nr:hypothetical protein [Candidatus Aenigmarchaeota archaeon]
MIFLIPVIAGVAMLIFLGINIFSAEWFGVLIFTAAVAGGLLHGKKIMKRELAIALILFFLVSFSFSFYYRPAEAVARGQGTILDDNWFSALNWLHDNTANCTVIATYWDPGHFITGIARRPVVFDGASQGATRTFMINGTEVVASRIQDIATTLLTSDEDKALDILRKYRNPNCNEMYYIASQDLLGKSVWWSYFSTWDATRTGEKGDKYSYAIVQRSQSRPVLDQNAIAHIYPLGPQQAFVIYETNNTYQAFLQQGSTLATVGKIFYFDRAGQGNLRTREEADISGLIWLTPDKNAMIFAPPQLENSLFTRMYLFNGLGLNNFELVGNYGGEVKLFKVKFKDPPPTDKVHV